MCATSFSLMASNLPFWLTATVAFSPAVSICKRVAKIFKCFTKIGGDLQEKQEIAILI